MSARNERELLNIVKAEPSKKSRNEFAFTLVQYERLLRSFENQDDLARTRSASVAARHWRSLPAKSQDQLVRLVSGVWRHHMIAAKHEKALAFSRCLINRGKRLQRPALTAEGYLALGVVELCRGSFEEGIENLELSRAIFASIGNSHDVVRASIPCADAYRFMGEDESAMGLLKRARSICLELEEIHLLGSVLFTQGLLLRDAGNLRDAERCFRFVRDSADLLSSKKRFLHGTLSLSSVLCRQGRYDEAQDLAVEAAKLAISLRVTRDLAIANEYLGDISLGKEDYYGALRSYSRAFKYIATVPDDRLMAVELHRKLAELWVALGNPRYARLHLRKGISGGDGSGEDLAALKRLNAEIMWLEGQSEVAVEALIEHAENVRTEGLGYEHLLTSKRVVSIADSIGMMQVASTWWSKVEVLAESCGAASLIERWKETRLSDVSSEGNRASKLPSELPQVDLSAFGIITRSRQLLEKSAWIEKIAQGSAPVLLQGESGTGKELFASLVHQLSPRKNETFLALNCGALPSELLESELFGHRRGSFTGAVVDKAGVFRAAHKGTLFLDEIGEMLPSAQVKLLRVLENGEYRQVGETRTETVDVRVVAATNENLRKAIRKGKFRRDLYFRLKGLEIVIPPLRERLEDIPLLAEHFLEIFNRDLGKSLTLPFQTKEWLMGLPWHGNVRELRFSLEQAVFLAPDSGNLRPHHFLNADTGSESKTLPHQLEDIERARIRSALEASEGVITAAAKLLGITRTTLASRMKRLGISKNA